MKTKIEQLRKLMEKYDLFQQDDEVGIALQELEREINNYKEFIIFSEDFSDISLEKEILFENGKVRQTEILYYDNKR